MFDDDDLDAEAIEKQILDDSRCRRADPRECVAEFVRTFWSETTEEDVRYLWQHQVTAAPWYAEDVLFCLDAVIADPPPELEKFLRESGNLHLYHRDGTAKRYSDAEALAWLKNIEREFRTTFEASSASSAENC